MPTQTTTTTNTTTKTRTNGTGLPSGVKALQLEINWADLFVPDTQVQTPHSCGNGKRNQYQDTISKPCGSQSPTFEVLQPTLPGLDVEIAYEVEVEVEYQYGYVETEIISVPLPCPEVSPAPTKPRSANHGKRGGRTIYSISIIRSEKDLDSTDYDYDTLRQALQKMTELKQQYIQEGFLVKGSVALGLLNISGNNITPFTVELMEFVPTPEELSKVLNLNCSRKGQGKLA